MPATQALNLGFSLLPILRWMEGELLLVHAVFFGFLSLGVVLVALSWRKRRRVEQALRESEAKYRTLVETTDTGYVILDDQGCVVDANTNYVRLTGHDSLAEIQGRSVLEWTAPHDHERNAEELRKCRENGWVRGLELDYINRHGQTMPVEINATFLQQHAGFRILALCRNISNRKQVEAALQASEERLRALAARLQAVREEERTRLAREIHDELGQLLTGLRLDLRWIEQALEDLGDLRTNSILDKAVAATELVDEVIRAIQRIAVELRPGLLDRLGLVTALTYETSQFEQRTGTVCRLTLPEHEPNLPPPLVTAIFRIAQEALTNVARHANASSVDLELRLEPTELRLEIRDNGRGLTAQDLLDVRSLGLLGMKERARQLGGDVRFAPVPIGGTVVTVSIPLPAGSMGLSPLP